MIVVGNISVGGTGKTPVVLWLVDLLRESGYHPGIVTRGYGGSEQLQEVRGDSDPREAGDEPLLLARRANVPVFAGRERPLAAQALLRAHPQCDVIVSDDGLQHYALARDIELAVVDGAAQVRQWLVAACRSAARTGRQTAQTSTRWSSMAMGSSPMCPRRATAMRLSGAEFRNVRDPQQQRRGRRFAGSTAACDRCDRPSCTFLLASGEHGAQLFRRIRFPTITRSRPMTWPSPAKTRC